MSVPISISDADLYVDFETKMLDYGGNNELNAVERVYDDMMMEIEKKEHKIETGRGTVPSILHAAGNSVERN